MEPLQATAVHPFMRKSLPLLLALPIVAAGIWAKVTSGAEAVQTPSSEVPQLERRAWRTGIELLSPPEGPQRLDGPPVKQVHELPEERTVSQGLTLLSGRVVNADGEPVEASVFSTDCPGRAYTNPQGDFELYVFLSEAQSCDLQAATQHGMLQAVSRTLWVDVVPEQSVRVVLEVDDQPQGGIGVGFLLAGEGAVVTWVHPFGPAMDAGLQVDDVIVQVNDLDLQDIFDPNVFIQETVGPAGTPVEIFLKGEDQGLVLRRSEIREAQIAPEPAKLPDPDDEAMLWDSGLPQDVDTPLDGAPEPAWDTGWWDTGAPEDEIWAEAF